MKNFFYISILVIAFSACEKQIPFDDPGTETRLVLNSYITPGESVKVNLSESRHVLSDDNYEFVGNADIGLYEGNDLVETLVEGENGWYYGSHLPSLSNSYSLTCAAAGYDQISADTRIPTPGIIDDIEVELDVETADGQMHRLTFDVVDPGGQNWYHLFLMDPNQNYGQSFQSSTQFLETGETDDWYYDGALFTDDLFNSGRGQIVVQFYSESWNEEEEIDIHLVSASEEYYQYSRTLHAFSISQYDPFAQPVQMFSNVNGGHGAFTGYSVERVNVDLSE